MANRLCIFTIVNFYKKLCLQHAHFLMRFMCFVFILDAKQQFFHLNPQRNKFDWSENPLHMLHIHTQRLTEPARLETSPTSVNESSQICAAAMPRTKHVRFSPKNAWQRYHNCVAAYDAFCAFLFVSFADRRRDQNWPPWWIIIVHDELLDVPPFYM